MMSSYLILQFKIEIFRQNLQCRIMSTFLQYIFFAVQLFNLLFCRDCVHALREIGAKAQAHYNRYVNFDNFVISTHFFVLELKWKHFIKYYLISSKFYICKIYLYIFFHNYGSYDLQPHFSNSYVSCSIRDVPKKFVNAINEIIIFLIIVAHISEYFAFQNICWKVIRHKKTCGNFIPKFTLQNTHIYV
eukprot:TRINITY_DN1714_c0_g1_i1.p4 TRINITY_DN1714_c0_g1~~TRINITY_DN1714_c0_g1_i1.p4  ORF type:complete len:189 (+),score=-6.57 TRINITY_DN1714_c0_g1_i1:763-1329(+)